MRSALTTAPIELSLACSWIAPNFACSANAIWPISPCVGTVLAEPGNWVGPGTTVGTGVAEGAGVGDGVGAGVEVGAADGAGEALAPGALEGPGLPLGPVVAVGAGGISRRSSLLMRLPG